MFMTPSLGRKRPNSALPGGGGQGHPSLVVGGVTLSPRPKRREDERDLIATSPTESEYCYSITGNNNGGTSASGSNYFETMPSVSFSLPKFKTSMSNKVVQSLRLPGSSSKQQYSELGAKNLGGGFESSSNVAAASSSQQQNRPLLTQRTLGQGENGLVTEEIVQTSTGRILVARQGDKKRPAIITYHDLGLNYVANFKTFFESPHMVNVLDSFCVYHITAPGQESGAVDLPEDYNFPSMEDLSEQVEYVMHYYSIPSCVCFGVGIGANVLTRLAHRRPTMVDGLVLINCNSSTAGWLEWVYHKVNIKNLKKVTNVGSASSPAPPSPAADNGNSTIGVPDSVVDYLIWYHMGRSEMEGRSIDAVSIASIYKQHFQSEVNVRNLALLMQSYMQRTDLNLAREINSSNGKPLYGTTRSLKTPVLNMTGDHSPHVEATVAFNGRLQPNKCTWMKFQDAGMILEEQPAKVAEAVKLFLQGLGYIIRRPGIGKSNRSGSLTTEKIIEGAAAQAAAIVSPSDAINDNISTARTNVSTAAKKQNSEDLLIDTSSISEGDESPNRNNQQRTGDGLALSELEAIKDLELSPMSPSSNEG